jgi:Nucleotidyl transferase AbiEii toxin, Type IV TA system
MVKGTKMNPALETILRRYKCETRAQYERALKEILQELALVGLWRAHFFEHAAFYGGTTLRILYGLDRFSEDLDFTLLTPNPKYSLEPYHETNSAQIADWSADFFRHLLIQTKTIE